MATRQQIDAMERIERNYGDKIAKVSRDFRVPVELAYAIIYKESGGNPDAVSDTGDYGIAQMQPSTAMSLAKKWGWSGYDTVDEAKASLLSKHGENLAFAMHYYRQALEKAGGDPVYAYALYNGGLHRDKDLPDVYARIADRSFAPAYDEAGNDITSNIITNARGFRDVFSIMGTDPYSRNWLEPSPARQAEPKARDPFVMDAGTGSPVGRESVSVFGEGYTPAERQRRAETLTGGLRGSPVTGPVMAAAEGFGDMATNTAVGTSNLVRGALGGAPEPAVGWQDVLGEQPGAVNEAARFGGTILGMAAGGRALGLPTSPVGMGVLGALQPGTVTERAVGGGSMALLGGVLQGANAVVPSALVTGAGKLSPRVAEGLARTMARSPAMTRGAIDAAAITGLEAANPNVDFETALARGVGGAVGAGILSPVRRGPLRINRSGWKDEWTPTDPAKRIGAPAEMEVPQPYRRGVRDRVAQGITKVDPALIESARAARLQPVAGVRTSEVLTANRDAQGNYNLQGVLDAVKSQGIEGGTPEMRDKAYAQKTKAYVEGFRKGLIEERGEPKTEMDEVIIDAEITKKMADPKVQQKIKDAVDRKLLEDSLDPELTEWIKAEADNPDSPLKIGWRKRGQEFVNQTRFFQGMGGGKIGSDNLVDKNFVRPNQEGQEFTLNLQDQFTQRKVEWAEKYGIKEGDPRGAAIVEAVRGGDLSDPAAREYKQIYEDWDVLRREFNDAYGGKEYGYIENYAGPDMETRPGRFDLKGKLKRSWRGSEYKRRKGEYNEDVVNRYDFTTSPRRKTRTGSVENLESDPIRLLTEYGQDLAKDIGHNLLIKRNYAVARYAELNGFEDAAAAMRNYTDDLYKGQGYGVTGKIAKLDDIPLFRLMGDLGSWRRQQLYNSVFSYNMKWIMTTQPTSSLQTIMNTGTRGAVDAYGLMWSPQFRSMVDDVVYSQRIKARGRGSLFQRNREDMGVLQQEDPTTSVSAYQKFVDVGAMPGTKMEKNLGYYSAAARFVEGTRMGFEGRDLIDYMSDGIAKDQDMYDPYNRSPLLRSRHVQNAYPFQSFGIGVMENLTEQFVPGMRHGQYRTASEKGKSQKEHTIKTLLALGVATAIAQKMREDATGMGVVSPSLIPGYDIATGSGAAEGLPIVGKDIRTIQKEAARAKSGAREENAAKIVKAYYRMIAGYLGGGAQARRLIDTVANIYGADPYQLEGYQDIAHGAAMGPSATPPGDEYYDRHKGDDKDEPDASQVEVLFDALSGEGPQRRKGVKRGGEERGGTKREGTKR